MWSMIRSANYVAAVEILDSRQSNIGMGNPDRVYELRDVYRARVIESYIDMNHYMLDAGDIIEIVDVHGITFREGDRLLLFLRNFFADLSEYSVMFFLVNPTQSAYLYTSDFESFFDKNNLIFTEEDHGYLLFLRDDIDRTRRWPYAKDLDELADWATHIFRVRILDSREEEIGWGDSAVIYTNRIIYSANVMEVVQNSRGWGFPHRSPSHFPRETGDIIYIADYYNLGIGRVTFSPGYEYMLYLTFTSYRMKEGGSIPLFFLINSTQGKIPIPPQ